MPTLTKSFGMRVFSSASVGMLFATAVGVFAYGLAPFFDPVGLYAAPSQILIPVIAPLIPSSVVYRLVPEGGAPAGVLLILTAAFIFWTVIFALAHFVIGSPKRQRADR
jgi:hypothetical protein